MKKSYWILFFLAILSPLFVGIAFLLKYKEVANFEYFLYISGVLLIVLIMLAVKELITLLK